MKRLKKCEKCGSNKIEDRAESGTWWVYCHNCHHDHADDTEVFQPDWRGFDDEILVHPPERKKPSDPDSSPGETLD